MNHKKSSWERYRRSWEKHELHHFWTGWGQFTRQKKFTNNRQDRLTSMWFDLNDNDAVTMPAVFPWFFVTRHLPSFSCHCIQPAWSLPIIDCSREANWKLWQNRWQKTRNKNNSFFDLAYQRRAQISAAQLAIFSNLVVDQRTDCQGIFLVGSLLMKEH